VRFLAEPRVSGRSPDEAALPKAMGRGDLEACVREYARAEAVAPDDV
jgi:hypothetical protein